MMVYADYDYYLGVYCGTSIQSEDFQRLALRASAYIDAATMGRAASQADTDPVKMCCCALSEQYRSIDIASALSAKALTASLTADGAELQSQSVGSWAKSYRSGGATAAEAISAAEQAKTALKDTAKMYLAPTGLLRARGYGPCRTCFPIP